MLQTLELRSGPRSGLMLVTMASGTVLVLLLVKAMVVQVVLAMQMEQPLGLVLAMELVIELEPLSQVVVLELELVGGLKQKELALEFLLSTCIVC